MAEKILCPYCPTGVPMVMAMSHTNMRCPRCGSTSPVVNNLHTAVTEPEDVVLEMARRRYVPPMKPLTMAEAKRLNMIDIPLYVECNFVGLWHGLQPINRWVVSFGWLRRWGNPDDKPVGYIEEGYGIYWRCWARKPTEAERKAAPW